MQVKYNEEKEELYYIFQGEICTVNLPKEEALKILKAKPHKKMVFNTWTFAYKDSLIEGLRLAREKRLNIENNIRASAAYQHSIAPSFLKRLH